MITIAAALADLDAARTTRAAALADLDAARDACDTAYDAYDAAYSDACDAVYNDARDAYSEATYAYVAHTAARDAASDADAATCVAYDAYAALIDRDAVLLIAEGTARMAYITVETLKAAGASEGQVDLFKATFGDRVLVSRETIASAAFAATIGVHWAGRHLLRGGFRRAYRSAIVEAVLVCDAVYGEAVRAFDGETAYPVTHNEATHNETTHNFVWRRGPIHIAAVRDAAIGEALAVRDVVIVEAFTEAYLAQESQGAAFARALTAACCPL